MIVLDASALLAVLFDEPGSARVKAAMNDVISMSTVNLTEILTKFVDRGASLDMVIRELAAAPIEIVAFDADHAQRAAAIRRNVPRSLSLGDRACLALAQARRASVLTADRTW